MSLKRGVLVSAVAALALLTGMLPAFGQSRATRCTSPVADTTIEGDVVVPRGATCSIENTTVNGNVRIAGDADLFATNSTVNGNVEAQRNAYLDVFETEVSGQITLNRAFGLLMDTSDLDGDIDADRASFVYTFQSGIDGDLEVAQGEVYVESTQLTGRLVATGGEYADLFDSTVDERLEIAGARAGSLVCSSEVYGQAEITGNSEVLQIGSDGPFSGCGFNVWGDDVEINGNTADIRFSNNVVRGDLECEGNDPAPTGQDNRIRGEARGQCAELPPETDTAGGDGMARIQSAPEGADSRHAETRALIEQRRAEAGQPRG